MYNKVTSKKVAVKQSDLNITDYPADTFTPIGVVVIPASHDVYGTGECGVMSLNALNCDTPDTGGDNQRMYWGKFGFDIPELPDLYYVPVISSALTNNEFIDVSNENYMPSTQFTSNKPAVGNGMDTLAGYKGSTPYAPSPYLEDGSRNPSYYSTDTSINAGLSANCLSDFNGKENTEIILSYATAQSDWKTATSITNNYSTGYYTAACCSWRYHTEGTNQGDWYLPGMGELGYMMVRFQEIQNALSLIQSIYGNSSCVLLDAYDGFWSSSEYNSDHARSMYTGNGRVSINVKDNRVYCRGFARF